MDLIRKVSDYIKDDSWSASMRGYTRGESLIGKTVFFFLVIVFGLCTGISAVITFLTAPIWVIPYLIYRTVKCKEDEK